MTTDARARTALDIATHFRIDLRKDFFTLSPEEVGAVLDAADFARYRKPRHANGSRARYYFAKLQRDARDRAY